MDHLAPNITQEDPVLVTGAAGFIGSRVVEELLARGFRNIRCLVRSSSRTQTLDRLRERWPCVTGFEVVKGNLLSPADCASVSRGAAIVYHLAAGTGTKSFPEAFMNSVVATRNLVEAGLAQNCLKRFVSISSFSVYSNTETHRGKLLDECSPVEANPQQRGEAYCFAKNRQDQLIMEYGRKQQLPYVIIRPGVVYGPGKHTMIGRVGLGTFGIFLHLGGSNKIPLTYVDNCADAIVLAGLKPGIEGEILNVVDDDLPSSAEVLRLYKRHVRRFRSIYLPKMLSYLLFYGWEKYSSWSQGQLPPMFNRLAWRAYWRGCQYSNAKIKRVLGWTQRVSTRRGLQLYFDSCREQGCHA